LGDQKKNEAEAKKADLREKKEREKARFRYYGESQGGGKGR